MKYLVIFVISIAAAYFKVWFSDAVFIKKNFKKYLILRNLESKYRPYLVKYFRFYNSLPQKDKLKFERRVQKFIDIKQFIPRGGIKEVSPEMKLMIAASAIQITFGYPDVYFRHFWRILIYPDNYYSAITRRYHKGEVNIRGIIVLSWKSFMEGFSDPSDGRNLAFHEMAHALRLINIVENEEYDFWDRDLMKQFVAEAEREKFLTQNSGGEYSFFRSYGLTNEDEFFSVAVECFFEKPAEFLSHNPAMYYILRKILKVDPAELYNNAEKLRMVS